MNKQTRNLVQSIHDARGMASLVVAGAGTGAVSALLGVAGASRTVLDIQVPYASSALADYAGVEPDQYVSAGRGAVARPRGVSAGGVPARRRYSNRRRVMHCHYRNGQD